MPKKERIARTKARKVEAKRSKRHAKGTKPQDQSLSRTQPWLAIGMSRTCWYEAGKPTVKPDRTARTVLTLIDRKVSIGRQSCPANMHVVPPPEERMTGQGHAGQGGAILRIVCNTEIEKRVEQMFEECKRLARENPITIVVQEAA